MWKQWQLGAKALAVARAAGELLRSLDVSALTMILLRIIELERELSTPGAGPIKASRLIQWFAETFPQLGGEIALVRQFADAVVGLFNLVQLFRK
jgi:hypothetical protein